MKIIKYLLFLVMFIAFVAVPLAIPSVSAQQDPFSEICKDTPDATVCANRAEQRDLDTNSIYGPNGIVTSITKLIVLVVGIASVIVIIISGLQYVMSTGDPAKVAKSKDAILFALIGIVIAVLAQAIVVFVLKRL